MLGCDGLSLPFAGELAAHRIAEDVEGTKAAGSVVEEGVLVAEDARLQGEAAFKLVRTKRLLADQRIAALCSTS